MSTKKEDMQNQKDLTDSKKPTRKRKRKTSIISKYLYGWDNLEPVLMGCLAQGQNILLLGQHGIGKTSFMKFVGRAMQSVEDSDSFRVIKYNAEKEDMISMVGVPNPKALQEGRIDYATHERSIFHADAILVDEITRAGRENQNLFLEILEEKTVYGKPLKYKFAIATANDETYQGTYKLDAALLDRFCVVVPIPGLQSGDIITSSEEIKALINLNLFERERNLEESDKELAKLILDIREQYDIIINNERIMKNIVEFTAQFFTGLLAALKNANSKRSVIISKRQVSNQFVYVVASIAAYFKVNKPNDDFYLQNAAKEAIKYAVTAKLGIVDTQMVMNLFSELREILTDADEIISKVKLALNTGTLSDKVGIVTKHIGVMVKHFEHDEKITSISSLIEQAEEENIEDLVSLSGVLSENKFNDACEMNVKLKLLNLAENTNQIDKLLYI